MSDLIDRVELFKRMNKRLDILRKECGPYDHFTAGYDEAIDHVMEFPAVEAEPVRHGRWVYGDDVDIQCSECGKDAMSDWMKYTQIYSPYCPSCGAKMDGGAEDD